MKRLKKLLVAAAAIVLTALFPVACRLANQVAAAVQPAAQIYSGVTGHSSLSRAVFLAPTSGFDKDSLVFSDDGKHDAWISGSPGAQRIVADGVPGQIFSRCSGPTFSPADKLFYWAIAANRIVLVADNQVIQTPLAGEGSLDFSADGKHWVAFGAEPETQNGSTIMAGSIAVYEDGLQIGRYDDVSYPAFSADGKHLAFVAMQDDRMRLIVDGKVSLTFDAPKVQSSMLFRAFVNGPNMFMLTSVHYGGDSLIALVQDANGWTIINNGRPVSSYLQNIWGGGNYQIIAFSGHDADPSVFAWSLTVAESAPMASWWEHPSGKGAPWRVVLNGQPADAFTYPSFWPSGRPVLSQDGKHLAYAADSGSTQDTKATVFVVSDGIRHGPYVNVWGIQFTTNGRHLAYAASDGSGKTDWSYYLDGKPFGEKYTSVFPPHFSSNGRHVAWQAIREGKQVLVVDGEEVGTTDQVFWGPEVLDSGATNWVVRDGATVARVTTKLK